MIRRYDIRIPDENGKTVESYPDETTANNRMEELRFKYDYKLCIVQVDEYKIRYYHRVHNKKGR
jgi:hypothetical protein